MFKLLVVLLAVGYASASGSATSAKMVSSPAPPGYKYPSIPSQYANKCVKILYNDAMTKVTGVTPCPTLTSAQMKCKTGYKSEFGSYPDCCMAVQGPCSAASS